MTPELRVVSLAAVSRRYKRPDLCFTQRKRASEMATMDRIV